MARAYGAHGDTVTDLSGFVDAFEKAMSLYGPALIELRTDPGVLTPNASIKQLRSQARKSEEKG